MIGIRILDEHGTLLAEAVRQDETLACVDRDYQPGDVIVSESNCPRLIVQMDSAILPGKYICPQAK